MGIVVLLLIFIISVSPVTFFAYKIYVKDFDKEPTKILVKLFLCGVGSTFVTLLITYMLNSFFPFFSSEYTDLNIITLIPYVFLGVAAIEEFSKWIFVYKLEYNDNEFNHLYDGIVYAAFVSLGFACFENILYVFNFGISTGIVRAITAIPGHLCDGIIMGYFLSMAKLSMCNHNKKLARKNIFLSLLAPIIAHGIYDYTIMASQLSGYDFFFYLFIIFIVVFFSYCSSKVKLLADNTYNLNPNYISINDRKKIQQAINQQTVNNINNYNGQYNINNQFNIPEQVVNNMNNQYNNTEQSMNVQNNYFEHNINDVH